MAKRDMIGEVYQSAYASRLATLATPEGVSSKAAKDADKAFGRQLASYREQADNTVAGVMAALAERLESAAKLAAEQAAERAAREGN